MTSTLVFEGDGVFKEYVGGYDDWLSQRPARVDATPAQKPKLENTEGALKPESVSTKQERIAMLAKSNPAMAFTSLNHYVDYEWVM